MKNMKSILVVTLAAAAIGVSGVAFAATVATPAEIAANLTGRSVEDVQAQRAQGDTYGTISSEAGKLNEFKASMLENKKTVLDQQVAEGKLTQEQADEIYSDIQERQTTCDGTGSAGIGRQYGVGFGSGRGNGSGQGCAGGMGSGGRGNGRSLGY